MEIKNPDGTKEKVTVKEYVKKKKYILIGLVGIITAVVAWADGNISLTDLITQIWASIGK